MSLEHGIDIASTPLQAWADWSLTRRNLVVAHGQLPSPGDHPLGRWLAVVIYSLSQPNYGGLVALLPGHSHAPEAVTDAQPQIPGVIRVLQSILIDTLHIPSSHPFFSPLSPSTELLELRDLLFKDFHAHDSDASHSDYGGPSTEYTSGHSSPDMDSLEGSPVAYSASLVTAPTALRFIDAGANISLEAHRSAFVAGSYTRLRNPVHVKGIDVHIHGYGLVELHLAYQDGHSRRIRIRAAHAPSMSKRGAPSIISQEHLRKRHNISFHYPAVGQPTASDAHGDFILVMYNNLPHLQTINETP